MFNIREFFEVASKSYVSVFWILFFILIIIDEIFNCSE